MDAIVSEIGKKNNCTFCGVFRRQALDRGASSLNVDHIVTGHNADDIAETILMNGVCHLGCGIHNLTHAVVMRGDIARLGRCTLICTQGEDSIKRSKPFKYAHEKEIVMFVVCRSLNIRPSHSPEGMRTSRSSIIFRQNVSIPRMHIADMHEHSSRTWKLLDPA